MVESNLWFNFTLQNEYPIAAPIFKENFSFYLLGAPRMIMILHFCASLATLMTKSHLAKIALR